MSVLSRTVRLLALVSLFADIASEMLYPILPAYLSSIGFSVVLIGLLEGLAEATAGLSKGYFGHLSDRLALRMPFVRAGYGASALAKPLLGLFAWPLWVFVARTLDRLGKGLRTGARDAILAAESTKETKGQVFGFHRSMDTVGAVLGPAIALVWLYFRPGDYRVLFFFAFLPALVSVLLTFFIREKPSAKPPQTSQSIEKKGFFAFLSYWKKSPTAYRSLLVGLLVFQFFNSSDAFLLLKMKNEGLSDTHLVGAYIFYNLVFALGAWPLGILADRWGMKKVFLLGIGLFSLTYVGFAGFDGPIWGFYLLFLPYGLYAAATQGVAKAWISKICKDGEAGTAIGTYAGLQSVMALLASVVAGLIWQGLGADALFWWAGLGAIGAGIYLAFRFSLTENA